MGKPKDGDGFGGDGRERNQSTQCKKAPRQPKELDTGRNTESPKGSQAALLAAWGKWFNAGLRHGMSLPRRTLRASISVETTEDEQQRGHWAQR